MGLSDSQVLKVHRLVSGDGALRAPETKAPIPQKGIRRGPLAEWVLPSLVGAVNKERTAQPPSIPLIPPGWQVPQWPAAAFSLAGDECGEGNFSAEAELLRADCR